VARREGPPEKRHDQEDSDKQKEVSSTIDREALTTYNAFLRIDIWQEAGVAREQIT
jgi:hypothetical protein